MPLKPTSRWDITGTNDMGDIKEIFRTENSVTVITEQGHSVTKEQWTGWSDSHNNQLLDEAIEEALAKDN